MYNCVVCKIALNNYTLLHNTVRDDIEGNSNIVSCNICGHIQLFGFRENLKEHYDKDLQTYDLNGNIRDLNMNTIIEKEKTEIKRRLFKLNTDFNNKSILDVGGGYCTFSKTLLDNYPSSSIIVLEPSQKRSDVGKKINNILIENNIKIINSYLDDDFSNKNKDTFDYIFMWHVLEHIDDKNIDKLLQNLMKVCKKNGKIIIEVPNGNDELFKYEKYKNINYMIHHISYFTKETLEQLLKLNEIKNYNINFVQRYGFKNYLNWSYKLDYNLKDDMYYPSDNIFENLWIEGKIKNENTDAIWIEISK